MGVSQNQAFQRSSDSLRAWSLRPNWKLLVSTLVFTLCIMPTLVSYASYSFRWDDSDYLWRSIAVSRAFWNGNSHDMHAAMVSIRPSGHDVIGLALGTIGVMGRCWEMFYYAHCVHRPLRSLLLVFASARRNETTLPCNRQCMCAGFP